MSTRVANRVVNKGGQPTKYRPAYIDEVKDFMGQGYSISAFAGHVGVSRETVYEWERTIPEFAEALDIARGKRVAELEKGLLKESQAGPAVTARIFALKNACPAEWRDRVEHTGADGKDLVPAEVPVLEAVRYIALALEVAQRRLQEGAKVIEGKAEESLPKP
jgi:hypothetical protein